MGVYLGCVSGAGGGLVFIIVSHLNHSNMLALAAMLLQLAAAGGQCPQVLNRTCLATSMPVLKELAVSTAAE